MGIELDIDWNNVIGGALGGLAFAITAGLGTWAWVKVSGVLRKKPMFTVTRKPGNRYFITRRKRGIVRDLQFTTGAKGFNTTPGPKPETLDHSDDLPLNREMPLPIDPEREVDTIHLWWKERVPRTGNGEIVDNKIDIFATKRPKGWWKEKFK